MMANANAMGGAAAMQAAHRRHEATFLHAPVGIAHVGLDGHFLMVNPRFSEICGYSAEALLETGFQQITHPEDLNADEALLQRLNAGEFPRYVMDKRYIRPDGAIVWVKLTVAMVRDEADRPEFYVAVIEDLSDLRQASFEAIHDPLTGLLNRRGLAYRAEEVISRCTRGGEPLSLLFIDLDGFKQLNDQRGHAAGDACLINVAQRLSARKREQDVLARVGGDEFVILFGGLDANAALRVAERLQEALCAPQDNGIRVEGSFGLATAPAASAHLSGLMEQSDRAMLAAKRAGRNRIMVAPMA